ncbi:MAG: hypothetical protein MUF83_20710 [Acidimicrobiales bacterium]|nr:hypothetical protein [Acidimicrobiales bacterium]
MAVGVASEATREEGGEVTHMRWAREHPWSVPFAALSVLSLIYLVLISRLGFYWDDWASVWTAESVGPAGLRELFADDRPLLGLLYEGFFSVVPSDPLLVQIMSIALRLLAALGVWAYVRTVWPKLEFEALTASLLFFVYPGFSQQAVALTYGLGAFFPLACLMWSIICSLQAARSPSRRALWVAAAIVLLLGSLVTEYFLVLEVLRLAGFLVLLGARRDDRHLSLNRANISVVSKAWLPYGLIYVPYLLWRMLALDPERADADARSLSRFIEEPVGSFKSLASSLVTDPVESSIGAWFQTTPPEAFERWIALFAPSLVVGWGSLGRLPTTGGVGRPFGAHPRSDRRCGAGLRSRMARRASGGVAVECRSVHACVFSWRSAGLGRGTPHRGEVIEGQIGRCRAPRRNCCLLPGGDDARLLRRLV